jgi:predicted secreted protein
MSWTSIIAIYFVVWWVLLFTVLPFTVRTQAEDGHVVPGTAPSAPARPFLLKAAIGTSIVSAVVVFGLWVAFDVYGVSVASLADMYITKTPQ